MFLQSYRRRIVAFTGGSMLLCLLSASVVAQEAPPKPSGTVTISQVQVAFIGSGSGGGGTLHFQGRNYPFKTRWSRDRRHRGFAPRCDRHGLRP